MFDLLETVDFDVQTDNGDIFAASVRMSKVKCGVISVHRYRFRHRDSFGAIHQQKSCEGEPKEPGLGLLTFHVAPSFLQSISLHQRLFHSIRQRPCPSTENHRLPEERMEARPKRSSRMLIVRCIHSDDHSPPPMHFARIFMT